ncbi:5' DNA nuclease [Rhizobium sp. AG855]|uniref:5' DNA nuclease n=1 Tax=Rhizobium sp. AG855 TaxID=2183898 RepID=UPI000E764B95|nr:5' DNA nuclease [Rhizobium sp. AG855]RKE85197.1 putative flap endonuclease-1-like 5' DNA nuclease [Rhizobium sp. AG855]
MTSSSDKGGKKGPDDAASESRASEGLEGLMTNPAAAMAAATAFGFGMAAQMSKLFLGSIQGAMDLTGQIARQLEEERKAAEAKPATEPETKVEAPVMKVEPAPVPAKVKAEKPVAPKVKAKVEAPVKPVAAKVEKPKPAPKAKVVAKPAAAPKGKAKPAPKVEVAAPAPKPKRASGKADDLKKIDGIGPKVEQMLKGRGITRFQALADMDEKALSALDTELGLDGRVLRDDWAGQARRLAGGKARSGS